MKLGDRARHAHVIDPNGPGGAKFAIVEGDDGAPRPAVLLPAHDGEPILPGAELAMLEERKDTPCATIRTVYRSGPARVTSHAYRKGWDAIKWN